MMGDDRMAERYAFLEPEADRYFSIVPSPVGDLLLVGDGRAVTGLYIGTEDRPLSVDHSLRQAEEQFRQTREELLAYFGGDLEEFRVPLAPRGTLFQREVWQALLRIPFGETRSYAEVAASIGRPGSARAVGMANGRNPISLIIPCHRVIGQDGSLTGYGWGLPRKGWLLAHEAAWKAGGPGPQPNWPMERSQGA